MFRPTYHFENNIRYIKLVFILMKRDISVKNRFYLGFGAGKKNFWLPLQQKILSLAPVLSFISTYIF